VEPGTVGPPQIGGGMWISSAAIRVNILNVDPTGRGGP